MQHHSSPSVEPNHLPVVGAMHPVLKITLYYSIRAELQTELPKDQTLLLLERLLSCVSYLAVGSVERASTIIRLLGKELLLVCTVSYYFRSKTLHQSSLNFAGYLS